MYTSSWPSLIVSLLAVSASALPTLEARKNGGATAAAAAPAAAGPASAKVTIYSSYTCLAPNTLPPTDGSAGTATTFTITEGQCTIPTVGLVFGGALTATLTAAPKAGTLGCYVLGHSQQGCGITLTNNLFGWPFGGTAVGNSVGCGNPPSGTSWNAFEVLCQ